MELKTSVDAPFTRNDVDVTLEATVGEAKTSADPPETVVVPE